MTYKNFSLDVDGDGIALVTWDMPGRSMNVFDESVLEELDGTIIGDVLDLAHVEPTPEVSHLLPPSSSSRSRRSPR